MKRRGLAVALITALLTQISLPVRAAPPEPEFIAVLELHQNGTRYDYTRKITDRFREELSRYKHLKVLTRDDSKAILNYKKSEIFEAGKTGSGNEQVSEAKKAYFELALTRAKDLSEEVVERTLKTSPLQRDYRSLQEGYTIQGIVALAQYRKRDASQAFAKLVYYNPQVNLDSRYFAPTVIRRIQRQKDQLKEQELGSIQVTAKPAAVDVYINGVFKGSTPLTVEGYPEGQHVVEVKGANYRTQKKLIQVKAGQAQKVPFSLKWKGKDRRYPADMVGFHKAQFENLEELIGTAAAAARSMRVRKLILVDMKREKGKDVIRAHIVDANLETFHRPQSVTVKNVKRESPQASASLATLTLDEMNQSIMDDPQSLAAAPYYGDVVLIGKSRSLLKNPWFWAVVGGAAAAGATAGALAGTGSSTLGAIDVIFR